MGIVFQKIYDISSGDYINFLDASHGFPPMGFNELLPLTGHHQALP